MLLLDVTAADVITHFFEAGSRLSIGRMARETGPASSQCVGRVGSRGEDLVLPAVQCDASEICHH